MKSSILSANVDASIVFSAGIFGSYHAVVEALILNSVETHARKIDVQLDLTSQSLTVIDNGEGLRLREIGSTVGDFDLSSKSWHNKRAGLSLAAISLLSDSMEITSISEGDVQAYKKVFTKGSSQILVADKFLEQGNNHGTSVSVFGLFYKFSVRRQSVNAGNEISLIKEFIQNMSIIHHNIHWTLCDLRSGFCLLQLSSTPSVTQRLIAFHGMGFVTKLCQVSAEGTKMTITGLISEPTSSSCCWNKDFQYLFINERWIKVSTSIHQLLNKVFAKVLLAKAQFGMTRKHRNLQSGDSLRYPAFVLQLTCPVDMIDILPESEEQQMIVFHDNTALQLLLEQLLRHLCPYNANLEAVIRQVLSPGYSDNDSSFKSFLSPSAAKLAFASPAVTDNSSIERQQRILQQQRSTQRMIAVDLFDSAFELSLSQRISLTPSTVPESPLMRDGLGVRVSRLSPLKPFNELFDYCNHNKVEEEPMQRQKRNRNETEDMKWLRDIFGSNYNKKQYPQPLEDDDKQQQFNTPSAIINQQFETNEDFHNTEQLLSGHDALSQIRGNIRAEDELLLPAYIPNERAEKATVEGGEIEDTIGFDYEEGGVVRHSLRQLRSDNVNDDHQPQTIQQSRSLDHLIKSKSSFTMHKKMMSIQKEAIHGMQVIGQVDKKYIAVLHHDKATTESTIMLLDQHAVDERLRYEKLYSVYKNESKRHTIFLPRPVSIPIDFVMLNILQQRESLFKWWCFDYQLQCDQESGLSQPTVVLLAVPCVYENEVLTEDDFLEFCHDIQMHHELPDHLQQPPSFLRIAASKACRTAIKFGQVLHMQEMQQMIQDLQSMTMPFQCAHGRPSCVPMLEMSELQRRQKEKEEASLLQSDRDHLNRFWEIYRELKR